MEWRAGQPIDNIPNHLQNISGNDAAFRSQITHSILHQSKNNGMRRNFEEKRKSERTVAKTSETKAKERFQKKKRKTQEKRDWHF